MNAPHPDRWAVIGAGPHGLAATKALGQLGIEVEGFERSDDVGGNWNFHGETSRVYQSTHLISTKPFTQFPDFPMPDAYPDYPSHWQVHAYLRSYADHFGLRERIHFRSEVTAVESEPSGGWQVTWQNRANGEHTQQRFAGVVIANGHNWVPKMPQYPGLESFTGELRHSADYKSADMLRGRRVLVIGAGNTGCDIAVEAAQHAGSVLHSTRRGYYYNPKYALGRPSDQTADLLLALRVPLSVRRAMYKAVLRLNDRVVIAAPSADDAGRLVERWYREHTRTVAQALVDDLPEPHPATLRIADGRSRWGSCSRTGTVSLSWRLMLAPFAVLDYVVVHELCHLRHLDHGPAFWAAVEALRPDWRESHEWLRAHGTELHAYDPAGAVAPLRIAA